MEHSLLIDPHALQSDVCLEAFIQSTANAKYQAFDFTVEEIKI